jgi:hypothetical protein
MAAQRKAKRGSTSPAAGAIGLLDLEPEHLQMILRHAAANAVKDPTALLALACSCKTLHQALKVFPRPSSITAYPACTFSVVSQ